MKYLLDASAVLAVLRREPGAERVVEMTEQAAITVVNLAEVVSKLCDLGLEQERVSAAIGALRLPVLPSSTEDGVQAGLLRTLTRTAGLSLGDRFCLAIARRHDLIAVTTDRAWSRAAAAVGVEIALIR